MKQLFLLRHAQSGWENNVNADIDRTLTKKGNNDAKEMASLISKNFPKIDIIISSPAVRAISTVQYFADAFNIDFNDIVTNIAIYEKNADYIRKIISEQDDSNKIMLLCGHNPMITNLVNILTNKKIPFLEACSVVRIDFKTDNWKEIENKTGKLIFIEAPL